MALAATVRKIFEWFFGCWYEGPQPPSKRFAAFILDFGHYHPNATQAQWKAFALRLAEQTYRSGWQRGYESSERGFGPAIDFDLPEKLADAVGKEWRDTPMSPRLKLKPDEEVAVEVMPIRYDARAMDLARDQLDANMANGKVVPLWNRRRR